MNDGDKLFSEMTRDHGSVDDRPRVPQTLFPSKKGGAPKVSAISPPAPPARRTKLESSTTLRTANETAMQLTSAPETEEPLIVINTPLPVLESEVVAFAGCSGGDVPLARARMVTSAAGRLARIRVLMADSGAQIDADFASAQALLVGVADAIVAGTTAVNDLATALAERAGFLRGVAEDTAELADAQARLADESALGLSAEQIGALNIKVALLPARLAERQAAADAAVAGIRAQIAASGVDLDLLIAEIYSATDRVPGGSFFADQRTTRTDVEAGRYALPD
jgi:hypothetical protein